MLIARECKSDTCPVPGGFFESSPGLAGNAFLLAAFASLIPLNIYTGVRYKAPLYVSLIVIGLVLEVVSHVGKILIHADIANPIYFSVYLVANLWGPTVMATAMYTALPHIMAIYGPECRIVSRPIYINIFFLTLNIFALAFQAVGSVFASNGTTAAEMAQGTNMAVAGLAMQFASLTIFMVMYYYINYRIAHRRYIIDPKLAVIFLSSKFKTFLIGIQLAAFLLIVRVAVRIGALSTGLSGGLFQSEVVTYLLDDTAVLLTAIILSLAPPGRAFGPSWKDTTPFTLQKICPSRIRLPLRSHERSCIRTRVISQPYPLNSTFTPGSSRSYNALNTPPVPSITSPALNGVYMRPAYEVSPVAAVPFLASEASSPRELMSPIRKKKMWASTPDASQMVNPNGIWS
ncbi:RTA1 like protein-domain-containing protein [Rhypophila decipiens]|uniref:RTA1 like protein-domain-containing protein n=1 Tax=Rhypophila decipiens TaxID=261697 RepID=A0AAN6Y2Q0_9PEZI|nr:RTA1 like protein-domain-containing protein [Rhypophila decipiens]